LTELYQGTLTINSRGQQTTIRITLPLPNWNLLMTSLEAVRDP
jgi:signal transduction histidine kinase